MREQDEKYLRSAHSELTGPTECKGQKSAITFCWNGSLLTEAYRRKHAGIPLIAIIFLSRWMRAKSRLFSSSGGGERHHISYPTQEKSAAVGLAIDSQGISLPVSIDFIHSFSSHRSLIALHVAMVD